MALSRTIIQTLLLTLQPTIFATGTEPGDPSGSFDPAPFSAAFDRFGVAGTEFSPAFNSDFSI